jgi:hypothetical protein
MHHGVDVIWQVGIYPRVGWYRIHPGVIVVTWVWEMNLEYRAYLEFCFYDPYVILV